jgi:glycerophosphoryl diester phosphodiesterase
VTVLYFVIGAVVILGVGYLFLSFPSARRHKSIELIKGKFIAHRGLHSLTENTPENSLPAFKQAVELGYPIEIDIHLTLDGQIVVFHDDTLDRMCGVSGRVEEKTLPELKALRLGNTNYEIPTLEECLQTVNGKVPLLIEFKCVSLKCAPLCKKADEILRGYSGSYLIQSFYPTVLRWYKKHRRDVCRGQLAESFKNASFEKKMSGNMLFNFLGRPDFVSYKHTDAKNISRCFVTKLGAYPVGWTFQSQDELNKNGKYFNTYIFEQFLPKEK